MTKEQQADLLVLLATFKSFNEQLYNLKGKHSGIVKKWFNRLINTANSYEKAIDKNFTIEEENLEKVYDSITDLIYMIKDQANLKTKEDE